MAGLRGQFQPELLGYTALPSSTVILLEILGLSLGTYLSISNTSQLLDLVANGGYRLSYVMVTIVIVEFANGAGTRAGGLAGGF